MDSREMTHEELSVAHRKKVLELQTYRELDLDYLLRCINYYEDYDDCENECMKHSIIINKIKEMK